MEKEKETIVLTLIGSFNPPTNAHLHAAALARDYMNSHNFNVKETIMVPAHGGYKKPGLLTGEQRYEMCCAMAEQTSFLTVESVEIKKDHWSRTIDTLLYLRELHKCRIMIVLGVDVIETFETAWREPDVKRILEEFGLVVLPRFGDEGVDLKSKCKYIEGREQNIYVVPGNVLESISSTIVRERIKEGKSINGLCDPAVCKIIEKNGYYK